MILLKSYSLNILYYKKGDELLDDLHLLILNIIANVISFIICKQLS